MSSHLGSPSFALFMTLQKTLGHQRVELVNKTCVQALLSAGASLVGKTHMDELAYSLNGENFHYGTPVNPACPDRIPGGSSSGSVVGDITPPHATIAECSGTLIVKLPGDS
jgi:hypothetical protein